MCQVMIQQILPITICNKMHKSLPSQNDFEQIIVFDNIKILRYLVPVHKLVSRTLMHVEGNDFENSDSITDSNYSRGCIQNDLSHAM